MEPCIHEEDFIKMKFINEKLDQILIQQAAHTVVISNLVIAQEGREMLNNYKKHKSETNWKKFAIISSVIIGILAIFVTLLIFML